MGDMGVRTYREEERPEHERVDPARVGRGDGGFTRPGPGRRGLLRRVVCHRPGR